MTTPSTTSGRPATRRPAPGKRAVRSAAVEALLGRVAADIDVTQPGRITRPWFAWADSPFGELLLRLHPDRPWLLSRRLFDG